MTRFFAILFGIAFIFAGVAGFLPTFKSDNLLFGYFTTSSLHNVVQIGVGVLAIMSATSHRLARLFFQVFGLIFIGVAVWSFWTNGNLIMMHFNTPDAVLHAVVGVLALLIGFGLNKDSNNKY